MASDGVFDNMYDEDIELCIIVSLTGADKLDHKKVSDCIVQKSFELGKRTDYISPFGKGAKEANVLPNWWNRGKEDDICVIVATIHSAEQAGEETF